MLMFNLRMRASLFVLLLVLPVLASAGCRQSAGGIPVDRSDRATIQIALAPPGGDLPIGTAIWTITLTDNDGRPVEDATVLLRGDMNHAGMTPLEAPAVHSGDGVYTAEFTWTMTGDWIVTVSATLADGTVVAQHFNFTVRTP